MEWLLVLCSKRSWTALSLAVLCAVGWVLVARHTGRFDTALGWALAAVAVGSGTVWVRTQQTIFRLRRALGRATMVFHLS